MNIVYMHKPHLQQVSGRGIYVTICKILLLLFCIWISYIALSKCLVLILKFNTVPVRLRDVTNFLTTKHFNANTCRNFLQRKYDVISQLRHSYAKGPFCVVRFLLWFCSYSHFQTRGNENWKIHVRSFETDEISQ